MPLSLTNITSLKVYFTALALSNVDIDSIKFGDEEVIKTSNRSDMGDKTLWVQEYDDFRFDDQLIDNILTTKQFKVNFLKPAPSEIFSELQTAKDECEAVIKQVIAKMLLDKRDLKLVTRISSWSGRVGYWTIGSIKYCGCEVTLSIQDPSELVYNPAKWA